MAGLIMGDSSLHSPYPVLYSPRTNLKMARIATSPFRTSLTHVTLSQKSKKPLYTNTKSNLIVYLEFLIQAEGVQISSGLEGSKKSGMSDSKLLRVVEIAHKLNDAFSVTQLKQVLRIFRSYVNVDGVEGGFALAPDELECVLGFPDDQRAVEFLVQVFGSQCGGQHEMRVDLVTLLVSLAVLARGALEEKAKFIFALVDLDTEDDIVEEELALMLSSCSNGLQRLGIHSELLVETDALALAYEAFEFVGVEDGEKMSFASFLRWCVFHERPRALFERLSILFSISDTIAMLQHSLDQLRKDPPQVADEPAATAAQTEVAGDLPRVQVGPVVGWVSARSAKILLECDVVSVVSCVLTDRITGEGVTTVQRTKRHSPVVFHVRALYPGRVYDVSFRGLADVCTAILQTPYEDPVPSWTLVVVADDKFLDGSVQYGSLASEGVTDAASSFVGDIATHVLPATGGMFADATLHLGTSVCLARDLSSAFNLCAHGRSENGSGCVGSQSLARYETLVRQCVRRHWSLPECKELFSRGAHVFSSVGILRSLLADNECGSAGIPLDYLVRVRLVLREYEAAGCEMVIPSEPAERYLRRLSSGVVLLSLDTLENVIDNASATQFVQSQATLLSAGQWEAIEALLRPVDDQDHCRAASPRDPLKLLVVLCDVPLVWHDAEQEARKLWHTKSVTSSARSPPVYANAWSLFPAELDRLLRLIFCKKQRDPAFHATILCCGTNASATTIRDAKTSLTVEQIVLGPISAVPAALSSSSPQSGSPATRWISSLPSRKGELVGARYSYAHEFPTRAQESQQYCVLTLVAHPRGSTSSASFLLQHQSNARLVVGPVIGRVTQRSARILVEIDRPAEKCVCVLTDTTTKERLAVTMSIDACSPTVFKMDGLRPGGRYAISFEGIRTSDSRELGYVRTAPASMLAFEWVVVQHNAMRNFIPGGAKAQVLTGSSPPRARSRHNSSFWPQILQSGVRAYAATASAEVCAKHSDTLGDHADASSADFNPWFFVEEAFLSEPMTSPVLVVHLGGQVDMSRAFSNVEVLALIRRIGDSNKSSGGADMEELLAEVRRRIQDVYRVAWGISPLKGMLSYASNLMLLNEEIDLFFSKERLKAVVDRARHSDGDLEDGENPNATEPPSASYSGAAIEKTATLLRATAFEFWQRYQNQLWVDINERDIVSNAVKNSTKFAFSTTLGICRFVFMNLSHEAHELRSTRAYSQPQSAKTKKPHRRAANALSDLASTAKGDDQAPVNLFTNATWKTLEDALMPNSASTSLLTPATAAPTTSAPAIQQLVVVVPADFVEWTKLLPQLRPDMKRVFEKCFAWKAEARDQRSVVLICSSDRGNSLALEVADTKLGETLSLSCVGSISEPRKPQRVETIYFSKRIKINKGADAVTKTAASRTFASYHFLSDFRSGFLNENLHYFPPRASSKATVGPVLGRIFFTSDAKQSEAADAVPLPVADANENPAATMRATALILLEINADARVVCIVTNSLANEEIRVVQELSCGRPHVFRVPGLLPETRYMYRFEVGGARFRSAWGIYNAASRRGSFHTPCLSARSMNVVALSSSFPEQMSPSLESLWVALFERVQLPWCGIDALLHLGGQVPLHEAAVQCFEWLERELQSRRRHSNGAEESEEASGAFVEKLRRKVRRRFQQHYHLSWNLPHVREILASVSNWFLPSQADVAPFLRNQLSLHTTAARVVLDVAKQVVAEYQLALMSHPSSAEDEAQTTAETSVLTSNTVPEPAVGVAAAESDPIPAVEAATATAADLRGSSTGGQDLPRPRTSQPLPSPDERTAASACPSFVQTGEIGFFFCDLRAVSADDVGSKITCNGRLSKPLASQEHPVISETQWLQLEVIVCWRETVTFARYRHATDACVLCPVCVCVRVGRAERTPTQEGAALRALHGVSADPHERRVREPSARRRGALANEPQRREARGRRRQLGAVRPQAAHAALGGVQAAAGAAAGAALPLEDQAPRPRRTRPERRETSRDKDALAVGDTLVLSLRNITCGPVTASVEPFEFPLSGVACPTFGGGAKDERFTFAHRVVSANNYVLAQLAVGPDPLASRGDSGGDGNDREVVLSATVEAAFVVHGELDARHPVDKCRRFPSWWREYIPMRGDAFWGNAVRLRAESDADVHALRQFVDADKSFAAAVELFYEKHQFAETARMEELRSAAHAAQRFDLKRSLRAAFADVWKALPEGTRQRLACFLDPFVFELLLEHVAPTLLVSPDGGPNKAIELAFFCGLCRDVVFSAGVLHLAVRAQREDAIAARERARREERERATRAAFDKEQLEAARAEEQAQLEQLLRADPTQYATQVLARENAHQEQRDARARDKLERKRAERVRELEEERAIAREQKALDRLAATDPNEYARRQGLLETRERKLREAIAQRAAEKKRKKQQAALDAEGDRSVA
ncbi:hypothetical protein PybrP1_003198 [[Pythium] brassicae (nom. inval.)]|nr:hypothetical protein PybrP1_003198 [[Pythium] brassicae (nom. inval.)]